MKRQTTIIAVAILLLAASLSQSAGAWHARFESREDCMYYYKIENFNTTGEAGRICDKIISHTNVTISIDNKTSIETLENK